MTQNSTLQIDRLAHKGDGVAINNGEQVFIALTLPQELVEAEQVGSRFELNRIIEPSPERVEPICLHFGSCGGCTLQHASSTLYSAFKRQQIIEALKSRGIEHPVEEVVPCPPQSRRRAVLTAVKAGHKILMGYHGAKSHRLVDIKECPVLLPEITEALPNLRKLASKVIGRKGELKITVTSTESGLDICLNGLGKNFEKYFLELSQDAMEFSFARLTAEGETVLELKKPNLHMGEVLVTPPSGGFLQATQQAEDEMADLVLEGLNGCKKVIDLFAGSGTFTFRLAKQASVLAVESDAKSLKALDEAKRQASKLKKVEVQRRDLFRRPLTKAEIYQFGKGYDGVVIDPPRSGALEQSKELAQSSVKRIVSVSCNPATFARDLKVLTDGNFKITKIVPVDQFLYSPHVEVVALLENTAN
ncbi:class I SAM-dependent RNA methyltransferase [Flexibacterium corallicola]|uniref:class I SAM-dependent RNA methyltransferase n=1 Tax=Flexibacterium corallicola TaxID=3037259 RepID=UPI00286F3775|nr:class I SAM-dependent RNA methyltransferase [Pseudovibrio sp. M1P-2-3]